MLNYNYSSNNYNQFDELVDLIEAKTNYKRRIYANGYKLRCPVHGDNNPSLGVREGHDGKILIKCFTGCPTKDVLASIGKTMRDLFPRSTW